MVGKYDGRFNNTDGPRYKLVEEDVIGRQRKMLSETYPQEDAWPSKTPEKNFSPIRNNMFHRRKRVVGRCSCNAHADCVGEQ